MFWTGNNRACQYLDGYTCYCRIVYKEEYNAITTIMIRVSNGRNLVSTTELAKNGVDHVLLTFFFAF